MGRKKLLEIDDKILEIITNAARAGFARKRIAELLGLAEKTFEKYRKEMPEIEAAYLKGKANADLAVGLALFKGAISGSFPHIRWYEMTRCNMTEKVSQTTTEVPYVVEVPPPLDHQAWTEKYGQEACQPAE